MKQILIFRNEAQQSDLAPSLKHRHLLFTETLVLE